MGNTASAPASAGAGATASPIAQSPLAANLGSDLKPAGEAAAKVKPCCVCKEEKAARDECMLFSKGDNPQEECASLVDKYRSCMKGFGFETH